MKRFITHIFIVLYLIAMFRPVLPLFEYLVNQDYIAEFLCINKDKPELSCNGKCYLAKQLQKASEEKRNNLPAIEMKDYPIGIIELLSFQPKTTRYSKKQRYNYSNMYSFSYLNTVFHPPTIA